MTKIKIEMAHEEWLEKLKQGFYGRQSGNSARVYKSEYDNKEKEWIIYGISQSDLKEGRTNQWSKVSHSISDIEDGKKYNSDFWITAEDNRHAKQSVFTLDIIEDILKGME